MQSKALPLEGAERAKAYQEIAKYANDQIPTVPVGYPTFYYALSNRLDWTPRPRRLPPGQGDEAQAVINIPHILGKLSTLRATHPNLNRRTAISSIFPTKFGADNVGAEHRATMLADVSNARYAMLHPYRLPGLRQPWLDYVVWSRLAHHQRREHQPDQVGHRVGKEHDMQASAAHHPR